MVISTVRLNAKQAVDDYFELTESDGLLFDLDVISNDHGGNSIALYSLATNAESELTNSDLMDLSSSDVGMLAETTSLGASISIVDGKILYNASSISALIQALYSGQTLVDEFSYGIRLGNGTISVATVQIVLNGVGSPSPTLVFSDHFDRPDSETMGNGWVEYRETSSSDPNFFGSAGVAIDQDQANFRYAYSDGDSQGATQYVQPFVYHELSDNLAQSGFKLEFDISPGESGRIRQLFGLFDTEAGLDTNSVVVANPLILPDAGIAIELFRTNSSYNNSGIKVFQFNGDTDFNYEDPNAVELTDEFALTQFQFDFEQQYHVKFEVDEFNNFTIDVSNGELHEVFAGTSAALPVNLDGVFLSSTETGSLGTDNIRVDNLELYVM
jgi:hypothetical protein